jgi:SAM-dependent methyltransferase
MLTQTETGPPPEAEQRVHRCRFCQAPLTRTFVDLGSSPLCESFLTAAQLDEMEPYYPLHVRICDECLLVQLPAYVAPEEIFTEYAYFSAYSTSWVEHARRYAVAMKERLGLDSQSLVVELASNDGYLLQHFLPLGVPVLGIEPALNVAAAAEDRGVKTLTEFFTTSLAEGLKSDGRSADLIAANNVLAQVPDINDFVAGIRVLLKPQGVCTVEVPHLARLIEGNQFDTIYHEHFSYFSVTTARRIFAAHDLELFDVDELSTHGGSVRLYFRPTAAGGAVSPSVDRLLAEERDAGYATPEGYAGFERGVRDAKNQLLEFLIDVREQGLTVAGYGAPGKGNTMLNYCGIRPDLLPFTVDRNPYKHGRYLPGSHIPILPPEKIDEVRPDRILILPWNLRDEIVSQLADAKSWGARFVVAIPRLDVQA